MQIEVLDQRSTGSAFEPSPRELNLHNILVPTDLSEHSLKALSYGSAFAQQFGATLWLLHTVTPPPGFTSMEGVAVATATLTEKIREAEPLLTQFAAKHVPPTVALTSLVRDGSAVAEISSLARERDIDLVVVTTHGRTGLNRALFGSVAERIVHHSPCPILIVHDREHEFLREPTAANAASSIRFHRILVALDCADCSTKALRYAVAFARQFGAEIFCLQVLPSEKPMLIVEFEGRHKRQQIEAERKMAARLREIDPSIPVSSEIRAGAADTEIIELADEQQSDLIIIGEHRRRGAERFTLDTTTDQVIRRAHCPVLVVREFEHEFVT